MLTRRIDDSGGWIRLVFDERCPMCGEQIHWERLVRRAAVSAVLKKLGVLSRFRTCCNCAAAEWREREAA